MAIIEVPELDDKEREVIHRTVQLKEDLRYIVDQSPRRWQGLLRRTTFARAIRGSNSIEGYTITVDDAIAAAAGEEPLDATAEAWAAVTSYRTAMTCVLQVSDDPYFSYSTDWIRSLHFMMLQYDLSKNPGKWRPGAIYVRDEERNEVVYEGPDAEAVPQLMDELVAAIGAQADSELHPMVVAAMGHLNLAMIHPFSDGNGRMARCLQTLILSRSGPLASQFSSIEEYLGRNTRAYYDVLARVGTGRWSPQGDTRPWLRFCLTAHYRQAMTLLRRSREYDRLWDLLYNELVNAGLPERIVYALLDAAVGYSIRNATYRSVAELSEQVASRDLGLAVRHGFLVAKGEKRGRSYVASPKLREIRLRTVQPKGVPDPFAELGQRAGSPLISSP